MLMLDKIRLNNTISCGSFDLHIEHLVVTRMFQCEVSIEISTSVTACDLRRRN